MKKPKKRAFLIKSSNRDVFYVQSAVFVRDIFFGRTYGLSFLRAFLYGKGISYCVGSGGRNAVEWRNNGFFYRFFIGCFRVFYIYFSQREIQRRQIAVFYRFLFFDGSCGDEGGYEKYLAPVCSSFNSIFGNKSKKRRK